MATTRIMPLHVGKGRTESRAISDIIDYVANPQKTDNGKLITGYACDSRTADAEFLLAKRQYIAATGRVRGADDVIAYHVRQSFKPGEITPEEANRLGVEFAKRFTKGNHAFVVCTHIDKSHIHNHIIWSSVSLEYDRKFRNFWGSTKAVRRLSDTICIENGLSIVENPKLHGKSYNKWLGDQAKPSHRELLRVAIDNALSQSPADFEELDSLTTLTMNKENNIACGLVYETLVAYEDGKIVPELAEEWGWDETNTVLTFKLRQDVAFTDGAAFNAESVKEILDFDRSNPNFSGIKGIYNIESVEVVDEYTVAVHYAAPCFSYINDFCFQNVAGMMSPNVFEAENFQTFTDVVGTGPYIREEMISGDCTRFVRNENYWGEAPYYDEVVIKYIPEASSRLQALQTGEVDLIYGADLLSYDDYNQALSLDGIEGAINDGNTLTRNLVLNASSEILSDLKVRQAIAYAVNKEEITKGLTYGYETPATSLFAPGAPYTDITYNSTWSYDLDKANALLDEAGWVMNESTGIREKDGQQLSLNYTYWTDLSLAQDMALAIKTQLAEVGIDVTTTGQDQMTWWTEGVAGNYDITTWNTEGSYTEPHKFLQESLGADPHAISLQALEDFQSYSDAVNGRTW